MQDFEKILKQFQTTKEELARTSLDRDTKSTQLRTIEASLASL
jgi:chaperonin cofactor prefoldin